MWPSGSKASPSRSTRQSRPPANQKLCLLRTLTARPVASRGRAPPDVEDDVELEDAAIVDDGEADDSDLEEIAGADDEND
jgi:hypothetical protein